MQKSWCITWCRYDIETTAVRSRIYITVSGALCMRPLNDVAIARYLFTQGGPKTGTLCLIVRSFKLCTVLFSPFLTQGRNQFHFLGLGYCTEQNTDGIPSFVQCSLLRNGDHSLHQKVVVVRPIFGGTPLPTPSGCALVLTWTCVSTLLSSSLLTFDHHFVKRGTIILLLLDSQWNFVDKL